LALGYGVDPMPFIMAVLFGASASFISPYGYQTNLLVYSVGSYKLTDYIKIGLPISLVYSALVLTLIPMFFPF
ncbi:SLC13 family permease, partial [Vibrio campbellii]